MDSPRNASRKFENESEKASDEVNSQVAEGFQAAAALEEAKAVVEVLADPLAEAEGLEVLAIVGEGALAEAPVADLVRIEFVAASSMTIGTLFLTLARFLSREPSNASNSICRTPSEAWWVVPLLS